MERTRRLRTSNYMRDMVRENHVRIDELIYPIFVTEGENIKHPVESMPGIYQYSLDRLSEEINRIKEAGIKAILIFGIPDHKDEVGSGAYAEDGIVPKAIRQIKKEYEELLIIADVCLCEYTSHGHCGLVKDGVILNDETLPLLAKASVSYAKAGADIIAPSDMMDLRVKAIREALDEAGFVYTPIMSYSAKFASGYYGPFVMQHILHQDLEIEKHTRWITIIQEKQCVTFRMTLMKEQISSLSNQHSPSWIF